MANEMSNNNNDTADDFLSYHRSLGKYVLETCALGTGWLLDDISASAQRFPPKTVLLKSSKCTDDGSIVLERLDDANLNSAFRARHSFFRQPLASDVLNLVPTSQVNHKVKLCRTVTMVTMVGGGAEGSMCPGNKMGVAFSERRRKVKGSTVKVTCKGLREIAVDFGSLANKLATLSLKANLGIEDSFLVVTHVLVAEEFSWTKEKSEVKSEKYGGKLTLFPGTCLGCLLSREKETPEKHVHVVGDAILAYKLAKVKVADRDNGTIARDGVSKEGEFEGNYTFACEEVDRPRAGKYALRVTYRQEGHPRLSRSSLVFRLIGTTGTEDHTIKEEGLLFSGTYRTLLDGCSSGLFPLRGVRVLKVRDRPKKLMDWIRVKFTDSKDRSRLKLIKVTVTDVQRDVTQVCKCEETEVARGDWAWFGCDGQDSGEGYSVNVQYTPEAGPPTITAVTVRSDSPLAAVMSTLARETRVPCARQAILLDSRELRNPDQSLQELGIVEGTNLVLKKTTKRQITCTDSTDSPDGGPPDDTDAAEEAAILDMDRTTLVTRMVQEVKDLLVPRCAEMEDQTKWQDVQTTLMEQITQNPDEYPEIPEEALRDIVRVFLCENEAADLLKEADDDISLFDVFCELSERLSRDHAT